MAAILAPVQVLKLMYYCPSPSPKCTKSHIYVAAKVTYIRLLHGKIGFLGFFSALAP